MFLGLRITALAAFLSITSVVTARVFRPVSVPSEPPPEVFALDELIRDRVESGWRVKHPPDLPGPYRKRLSSWYYYHTGPGCFVRLKNADGSVIWEEKIGEKQEYLTLRLETADGNIAHGLLIREE